jgi:hypothetical protein
MRGWGPGGALTCNVQRAMECSVGLLPACLMPDAAWGVPCSLSRLHITFALPASVGPGGPCACARSTHSCEGEGEGKGKGKGMRVQPSHHRAHGPRARGVWVNAAVHGSLVGMGYGAHLRGMRSAEAQALVMSRSGHVTAEIGRVALSPDVSRSKQPLFGIRLDEPIPDPSRLPRCMSVKGGDLDICPLSTPQTCLMSMA